MTWQNFSVYILIGYELLEPLLALLYSGYTPIGIRFGSFGYFSYLCIVKQNLNIYESNK